MHSRVGVDMRCFNRWRRVLCSPGAIFVTVFAVIFLCCLPIFLVFLNNHQKEVQEDFVSVAATFQGDVQSTFQLIERAVLVAGAGIQAMSSANQTLTRQRLDTVLQAVRQDDLIPTLAWAERFESEERVNHWARQYGWADAFGPRDPNKLFRQPSVNIVNGSFLPFSAFPAEEIYYNAYFTSVPLNASAEEAFQSRALLVDTTRLPLREPVVRTAIQDRTAIAAPPTTYFGRSNTSGVVFYFPVFESKDSALPKGFLISFLHTVHFDVTLERSRQQRETWSWRIVDVQTKSILVAQRGAKAHTTEMQEDSLVVNHEFVGLGRVWRLEAIACDAFKEAHQKQTHWIALFGGCAVALVLASLALCMSISVARRRQQMEQVSRNAQLRASAEVSSLTPFLPLSFRSLVSLFLYFFLPSSFPLSLFG